MSRRNPRNHIRNQMKSFVDKVKQDLDDLDDEEFLVVTNPKNKRIKHVIDGEEDIEMPGSRGVDIGMRSLCSHYKVSGTSLFRLIEEYDEMSEVMGWHEILDDQAVCKNCCDKV